jgi:hypothetical protein
MNIFACYNLLMMRKRMSLKVVDVDVDDID